MDESVSQSYEYCQKLSRETAGNFYYAFMTLPAEQFRSMCALYAFMRITDDLGDSEESVEIRTAHLKNWRASLSRACDAAAFDHPLLPALADVIRRTSLPRKYLTDVIDGVEMDLLPVEYATFADLERYCYHVAGAVGLACIHLWGYHDARALDTAVACGTALQLTNILRDVKEDAARGRVYLPREHLAQFGLSPDDVRTQACDERFRKLMQFETELANSYYQQAARLFDYLDPAGKPILETMLGIYGGLLRKIARAPERVLQQRVSLSKWRKLAIAGQALARHKLRSWFAPPRVPT
jgi:phytoene synthase